jgi:hypothetical protein
VEMFSQSICILAVFGLLGFTLWWLKKRGAVQISSIIPALLAKRRPRDGEKLLERVDGLQLSPTHSLSLVRMADRAVLIGISPSGFHLVESISWKSLKSPSESKP